MESYTNEITQWVKEGRTHQDISSFLRPRHPTERGYSVRSVRRFCAIHGIHYRSGLTESELDRMVSVAVRSTGNSYGRRTLHGFLRWRGVHVSENRISTSLKQVAPAAMSRRQHLAHRLLNPHPYHAFFFGEKLHIDQNEKLNRFGVTHILAVDGYSRKIVGLITIPKKNAMAIYNTLMYPLLTSEGMWEQVRVDHGTEFCLLTAMQRHLANFRQQTRLLVLQTTSTNNHRVERMWVEINQRVNYPVKRILVSMEDAQEIDMSNNVVKFCVSWTTMNVITPALIRFVGSWNNHRIPGPSGGIPNDMASGQNTITPPGQLSIPSTNEEIRLFTSTGGHLTPESSFGEDPIGAYQHLKELRNRDFRSRYPLMEAVLENVLHSDGMVFRQSVKYFIDITHQFSGIM